MQPKLRQLYDLMSQGKLDQARALGLRLLAAHPRDADLRSLVSMTHLRLGQLDIALTHAEAAAHLRATDAVLVFNHASLLAMVGKHQAAIDRARNAAALDPRFPAPWLLLAATFIERSEQVAAADAARAGLALAPGDKDLSFSLATALLAMGEAPEAIAILRSLMARFGDDAPICDALCMALNYAADEDPRLTFETHKASGRILARRIPLALGEPPLDPRFPRRLRLAFISPDLRAHSVSFFLEPLLAHLPREDFEVFVYHTNVNEDAVTRRLRAKADCWRPFTGTGGDLALARLIRDDRIDVAVELSGHTRGHSLGAMRLKAAPLQITYLGYPDTTGLPEIDARFVDSHTDPAELSADAFATERLIRLDPCFLCYQPPDDAPDVLPAPAPATSQGSGQGAVTFGSFNALTKLSDATLLLWGRVLAALPQSRLRIKAVHLREPQTRAHVAQRLTRLGLDSSRVELVGPVEGQRGHMAAYHDIDIALDAYPYAGTTTTCEALWMGVPVITRAGRKHASRVGVSLLQAAGLPDLIASTDDAFVAAAVALAGDPARRASLRTSLRDTLRRGVLCDGPGHARRFAHAVRSLWEDRLRAADAPGAAP